MSDYISKQSAPLGTEVLSDQLIDEIQQHAKTAAENVLLRGEAARLRSALERIHYLVLTDLDVFEKLVKQITTEALSGDTEPVGAQIRETVQWFAEQMEMKLRENDHKGGWEECSLDWLYSRLCQETKELWRSIDHPSTYNMVALEAADVANFAMMIADIARKLAGSNKKGEKANE
ncbi:hypothetical protein [Paenibacillus sp. IITD108]|uniref:hypothetical protein n=1 Tax=Paenibacillus sp. IITD108 TaxID=3116649 RepID=UPI002F41614D